MTGEPQPGDLTDLASVEAFLKLPPGGPDEPLLQMLISAESLAIARHLDRSLLFNPAVLEMRNGNNQRAMRTWEWPIVSINSVNLYGAALTIASSPNVDGLVWDTPPSEMARKIYIRGYSAWPFGYAVGGPLSTFPRDAQNTLINYAQGYWTPGQAESSPGSPTNPAPAPTVNGVTAPLLPADLEFAATQAVALRYRQQPRWADTAQGFGPERISFFMKHLADPTVMALRPYKRVTSRDL